MRAPGKSGHTRHRNRDGLPVPRGLNSQRAFGSSAEHRRKSRPRSAVFHGSWPCKRHRISSLRLVRLPPSRPPTKSGARAGGRQLSDRRLHRCVPGHEHIRSVFPRRWPTCRELNRAYICVRNPFSRYRSMSSENDWPPESHLHDSSRFTAGELRTRSCSDSTFRIRCAMASNSSWASMVLDGKPHRNIPLVRSPGTAREVRKRFSNPSVTFAAPRMIATSNQ